MSRPRSTQQPFRSIDIPRTSSTLARTQYARGGGPGIVSLVMDALEVLPAGKAICVSVPSTTTIEAFRNNLSFRLRKRGIRVGTSVISKKEVAVWVKRFGVLVKPHPSVTAPAIPVTIREIYLRTQPNGLPERARRSPVSELKFVRLWPPAEDSDEDEDGDGENAV